MSESDIKRVIVLGLGALKVGQAGEFDYSGSQALKALKEERISTVLLDPNITTIQTSEGVADKVYLLPTTPYFVEEVIKKEQPDGVLLAFGNQTALNCGTQLYINGTLAKYGVKALGTSVEVIVHTGDHDLFVKKLNEVEVKTPISQAVGSMDDAMTATYKTSFPVMIRSAYALGDMGSGICKDEAELRTLAESVPAYSSRTLVEGSLKDWKETEFEVIRGKNDHYFTVVSMENVDPLGVHTGESIVVAPACSLTEKELNLLKELSIKTIRHLGIVGECNIQYAFSFETCDYCVIEVNAHSSRSSALASKASGYPLAFIAAKLALGYGLGEVDEMGTPNSTYKAPEVDYMIVKIPRWDLTKFVGVSHQISSSMKSIDEIVSVGKSFEKIIQKGLRMIEQGMHGFVDNNDIHFDNLDEELANPTDLRTFAVTQALEQGYDVGKIHELSKITRWFLESLKSIVDYANVLKGYNEIGDLPENILKKAKRLGFSDFQIARYVKSPEGNMEKENIHVRSLHRKMDILPTVKRINMIAPEHPRLANYLCVIYDGTPYDITYYPSEKSVVILESGAYRISSSVEFDWCPMSVAQTARKLGYKSIMINYNPEIVSTDYDMCDRFCFDEPLFERMLGVIDLELPKGVIVFVGGQIPNNLAMKLYRRNVPVLGTSPLSTDRAENRHKFSAMSDSLDIDQLRWAKLIGMERIDAFIEKVGFPILIRPSYVLPGAAMNVCHTEEQIIELLDLAARVSKEYPVVMSEFVQGTGEIEFDVVTMNGEVAEYAISEHIEFAGVHSGDAVLVFPAQKIYFETACRIEKVSKMIVRELDVSGPFNIQFLAKDNFVKVIKYNLRASRSFPFISKVLKRNFIEAVTRIMLDAPYTEPDKSAFNIDWISIKTSQFSLTRLRRADPVLGVDMNSIGEVGCIGDDSNEALLSTMIAVGNSIPKKDILVSSGTAKSKVDLLEPCRILDTRGYTIYSVHGTAEFLSDNGIKATAVCWPDEESDLNIMDMFSNHAFELVINIPKNHGERELTDSYKIRRTAIDHNIPLITDTRLASASINAFCSMSVEDIQIKS